MRSRSGGVKVAKGACHGQRQFVSKRTTPVDDIDWLAERGYGVQDGGPSGLWIVWCDGFVEKLDFTDDPIAELEAVLAARKLVPYTATVQWWDDCERGGGALSSAFGEFKPLLVAKRHKNVVTVKAMAQALSYAARHEEVHHE